MFDGLVDTLGDLDVLLEVGLLAFGHAVHVLAAGHYNKENVFLRAFLNCTFFLIFLIPGSLLSLVLPCAIV